MPRNSNDREVKTLHNDNLKRRKKIEMLSMFLSTGATTVVGAMIGTVILPGIGTGIGAAYGFVLGVFSSILGFSFGRYFKPTGSGSKLPAVMGITLSSWCLGIVAGAVIGSVVPGVGTVVGALTGGLITMGTCLAVVAIDQIEKKFSRGPRSAMAPQGSSLETSSDASTHENNHQPALRTDSPSYNQSLRALADGDKNETNSDPDNSRVIDADPCMYGESPLMTIINGKKVQIGTVEVRGPHSHSTDNPARP